MIRLLFVLVLFAMILSGNSIAKSICSPYLKVTKIDLQTTNQYVEPCPVLPPCQCICYIDTKRLWIDCFYRQLTQFPVFTLIPTNQTSIEWNIDLAFNLFTDRTLNSSNQWIPKNMYIRYLIISASLAYDLIVQLNLTHRHLIDPWHDYSHLIHRENLIDPNNEYIRVLTDLTSDLRSQSDLIQSFHLSLAGEYPSPSVSILYLDHNLLDTIPLQSLYNATALEELYLSFNRLVHLPAYAFGFSHRLTHLDLSHNQISSLDDKTFERHPDAFAGPFLIDYLDLSSNRLVHLQERIFSYLVNLRLLKLQHNQILSLSAHVWTGLYRLKYLDLSHNFLENFTQIFYSSYLNELNHLKLSSNNISRIEPCEFLSMKGLIKLDLSISFRVDLSLNISSFSSGNNQLTELDSCTFFGLHRSLHLHLRSNAFEFVHPCPFYHFARSTIHLENNPLICNCSFNYLLQDRQSLAYTGEECRGGYAYQVHSQYSQKAVRKSHRLPGKKLINTSNTCRNTFKYYNNLCSKWDCAQVCSTNEQLIIQITTIATPSRMNTIFRQTLNSFLWMNIPLLVFVI